MKKLRETEEIYQIDNESRIKFVEMSSKKNIDYFKNDDPFTKKCEASEECLVCKDEENRYNCKTSNIGYSLECKLCKRRGKEVAYIGESARNGFIRSKEHDDDFKKKRKKSVMFKHVSNEHNEEEADVSFQVKITGKFKSSLGRIIDESRRIRNKDPTLLLNSKAEFHGPCIKRKVYEN